MFFFKVISSHFREQNFFHCEQFSLFVFRGRSCPGISLLTFMERAAGRSALARARTVASTCSTKTTSSTLPSRTPTAETTSLRSSSLMDSGE